MKNNDSVSLKKVFALILTMTFVLSIVLSGCTLGKDKDPVSTTDPSSLTDSPVAYIDPDSEVPGVSCPACGSLNVGDAKTQDDEHDEHYICYDCNCEWYVEDGTAYQIADNGEAVEMLTTKAPVYTTKKTTTTKSTAKSSQQNNGNQNGTSDKKPGVTTDDAAELVEFLATGEWLKYINWYIDEEGNITTEGDKGVLGFGYSTSEKCFYATGNAWQRNFGYSDFYDRTAPYILISYDTSKIYFIYDEKEWLIQLWKGQYGLVLLGAEVGVYNREKGSSSTYFNCAKDEERLPISLTLYQDNKTLFARKKALSWWMTGFVPGQMGVGAAVSSEYTRHLSMTTSIDFKDEAMKKAFVIGLKKCNFIYNNVDKTKRTIGFVEGSGTVPGTYSVSGNTVTLSWQ